MQKPGARAAFARPKKKGAARFPRNLRKPKGNQQFQHSFVPDVHGKRPGRSGKHVRNSENPWGNSYPAIVIPCRPRSWPRPLHGFPKTLKFLRKFNDSQRRARLAAAISKSVYLQRVVKFGGIPRENVFFTHGSFASQRRQVSRPALVALAKEKTSPRNCSTLLQRNYLSACCMYVCWPMLFACN